MRIYLYYVGKIRDRRAHALAEDYLRRASRWAPCTMAELRPQRADPWLRHPQAAKIVLDAGGAALSSADFAARVARAEREARDLVFLLGGADGLPETWRRPDAERLSLSPMTLPHELARVVLAEQIYRALASLRGHPYPR
ncbi:MAG: 23S rRNA (pseudouridine(1915)-N(3))-methyltransferase RlmH [Bryobacterales bacterium]|nr:23S rRNA (pseudouridine(1915)-N(3))-methyltransferase RlmH [Bryobacteraceae bacterium]MDW8355679.1 23S rRNA (pseudouridine(1915)-N(3))-methyltransferase RlmH [Bryobacterales bacterium]